MKADQPIQIAFTSKRSETKPNQREKNAKQTEKEHTIAGKEPNGMFNIFRTRWMHINSTFHYKVVPELNSARWLDFHDVCLHFCCCCLASSILICIRPINWCTQLSSDQMEKEIIRTISSSTSLVCNFFWFLLLFCFVTFHSHIFICVCWFEFPYVPFSLAFDCWQSFSYCILFQWIAREVVRIENKTDTHTDVHTLAALLTAAIEHNNKKIHAVHIDNKQFAGLNCFLFIVLLRKCKNIIMKDKDFFRLFEWQKQRFVSCWNSILCSMFSAQWQIWMYYDWEYIKLDRFKIRFWFAFAFVLFLSFCVCAFVYSSLFLAARRDFISLRFLFYHTSDNDLVLCAIPFCSSIFYTLHDNCTQRLHMPSNTAATATTIIIMLHAELGRCIANKIHI